MGLILKPIFFIKMDRNVKVLLFISILFGLALGIYEFIFPLYLNDRGISFQNMGIIFSLSSIAMFFIRIHAGNLADVHGRKIFYSLSLLGSGIANFFTPFTGRLFPQTVLKSLREACAMVQESIHSVALFETAKKKFLDFIGKTVGAQWIFQGLGALVAGMLLSLSGYKDTFLFNAGLLFLAFFTFVVFFKEPVFQKNIAPAIPVKKLYALDFSRPLMIITLSNFVFMIGMGASHSFIMPIFFLNKFQVSKGIVSIIMAVHRLLLGLPMLFVAWFMKEGTNLKRVYIWFVAIEGIAISVSAIIPHFLAATIVWLAHDYVGAAFWSPVQKTLIQQYSKPESRAYEVSKVAAFSTLGQIIGPLIAGWLAGISISAPFFFSGLVMVISALMLVPL